MAGIQEEIQTMNLYDLHSNPEELHGYSTREYKIPELAFNLAVNRPGLRPKLEPYIMKDPKWAYWYAKSILKSPWPEAEPVIIKDPTVAADYAIFILRRPWPEAEPYIMKNAFHAWLYASQMLKRRWPEAEPYIMKDADSAYLYTKDILRRRWPEAEPVILKDRVWGPECARSFKIKQDEI